MSEILLRIDGAVEQTLQRLLDAGFFKTKSDAIRAGILRLGLEFDAVKSREEYLDELAVKKMHAIDAEIKSGKKKVYTLEEIRKRYPGIFDE